jgi:predicted transcriptional regulator
MSAAPIGDAELEVLRYIQDHHPVTVAEVAAHFGRVKGHVRTTTLNVMRRLLAKRYLTRRKVNGVFRYSPRLSTPDLLRGLVRDFVDRALGGSLSPFVAYLAEDAQLTEADRAELKKLIESLDPRSRDGRDA